MPRPSKHVSPDTLGGRIRAAREQLQLSLAEVADGRYSTSLISQIERNRVDPSQESLRFLADRLRLSIEDLEILARQRRESEIEVRQYKSYEDLRAEAARWLANKNICKALALLEGIHFAEVPSGLRWRLAALRGQSYFEQRKFLKAQQNFVYAANEQPKLEGLPADQRYELMLLHLHLAGTYRELQHLDDALEQYNITLQMMNGETPSGDVAEAHWGIALIAFTQAHQMRKRPDYTEQERQEKLSVALEHAENAHFLYRSIGQPLRAAAVTVQIAQIEQALGNLEKVCRYLEELLVAWSYTLGEPAVATAPEKRRQQEEANIVSMAACSLAGLELEAGHYEIARCYVDQALEAGKRSYKRRRADAYLMLGRILEAINPHDPEAEKAFRNATKELEDTQRMAARSSAHARLAHYLRRVGKAEEAEQEWEQARLLLDLASASDPTTAADDAT